MASALSFTQYVNDMNSAEMAQFILLSVDQPKIRIQYQHAMQQMIVDELNQMDVEDLKARGLLISLEHVSH